MIKMFYHNIPVSVRIMSSNNNSSSPVARLIPILIVFAGLIGLYYLYQYLFGPKTGNSFSLITKTQPANVDVNSPITITSDKLPTIYEGGEFTISTWFYISNWAYRKGFNKSILSIGGRNFDTCRIYIGGSKPKLNIRFHTKETGAVTNGVTNQAASSESLDAATNNVTYNVLQTDAGLLDNNAMCDLPEVDLQRWVNLTVAVNGKTIDVYLDGKLSRSCVLPALYKVDAGGYSATVLGFGGFGGQIANTTMYDAALNPDVVYKNYMAGPEPITSLYGWFSAFFAPGVSISVSTS